MSIFIKLFMVLMGIGFYTYGELKNKAGKFFMGVPIALLSGCYWAVLTFFIACQLGYGDNNPLTKLVGKRWAIVIHGTAVGLASFPIVGWWAILGGIVSGLGFYVIAELDDNDLVKEPWVAIWRGIVGLIILIAR
jgi:hypothetical protein